MTLQHLVSGLKNTLLIFVSAFCLQVFAMPAHASGASLNNAADEVRRPRYLSVDDYQKFQAALPAPPAQGSAAEQDDITQLLQLQRSRTPADCQRANSEVKISLGAFYGAPYGGLTAAQVATLEPLFDQVRSDAGYFVNRLKNDAGRPRPYTYISGLQPCVPRESSLSYPSGHATTAVLTALVLTELFPQFAQQLDARSYQIALDRVLGGVHHPSDIVAGRLLANELYAAMQTSPVYPGRHCGAQAPS